MSSTSLVGTLRVRRVAAHCSFVHAFAVTHSKVGITLDRQSSLTRVGGRQVMFCVRISQSSSIRGTGFIRPRAVWLGDAHEQKGQVRYMLHRAAVYIFALHELKRSLVRYLGADSRTRRERGRCK
jgi:hypothetical protein